jgi:UDP-glucose 4-epimerase
LVVLFGTEGDAFVAKVLVTGSAGFIGGYVVEELLSRGHDVVGVDNYSKYGPVSHGYDDNPGYRFVEGDARDTDLLAGLLADCDHFIAGAAMIGGISYFHAYAYDLLATNERIMAASCDAAIRARRDGKLRKVTYLSSSMVFESTDRWPSKEGDERKVPPPLSSYGFQKLAVEYYAHAAWDQYKLPYTILRPFNCVGVGEGRALGEAEVLSGNVKLAMSHVVPDLVQKVVKGQDPLHILGAGDQVRHYTYGGDLATGIVVAMEHEAALNEDFNISTEESTTVRQLAEVIWKKIKGPDVPFRYISDDPFEFDVQKRVPDVTKAREVLGYQAITSLDTMLDEVIPWVTQAVVDGRL